MLARLLVIAIVSGDGSQVSQDARLGPGITQFLSNFQGLGKGGDHTCLVRLAFQRSRQGAQRGD